MYAYSMPQQIKNVLTVKHCIALLLLVISTQNSIYADAIDLGARCQHDMDCTDFIKGSTCSANGYCECAPYYVQFNATTCLSSQLLGGDCILNEQCTMKVSNSSCLDGACRCVEGYLQFRKHTCLGPAHPGAVCYSHAHCQMGSIRTHCDFLIPNLFGRCQCTAPARLINGLCLEDAVIEEKLEIVAPAPNPTTTSSTTTTSTTTTSTTTTAAPVQINTSTSAPILADLPEEPENESIEEQKLDEQEVEAADNGEELVAAEPEAEAPKGDEDNEANEAEPAEEEVHGAAVELAHDESAPVEANPTTSGPTLVNVAETTVSQMLTPADNPQAGSDVAEEETQTLSPEQAATDDYPYKIEEEYAEETPEQQQESAQQQEEAAEHAAEQEAAAEAAAVAEEEAEAAAEAEAEAVEDAQHPQHGHESADDTMKFDYENAQDEFDYADQQTEAAALAIVADTAAGKPLATNDDDVSVGNTATPSESDPIAIVKPEPQASEVEETAAEAANAPAEDGAVEQEQYVEEAAAAPAAAEEAKEEAEEAEATTSEIENANQQQQEVEAPSVAVAVAETATEQPAKPAAEEAFQQAIDEHENEQQIVAMLQPEANANDEAAQQQQESNDDNIKQEQVEESEPQLTQVEEQQQEVEEEGTAAAEEDEKETETKVDTEEEQQQSVDEPASITEAAIGLIDNDSDTANEAVEAVEPEAEATKPEAPSDSELTVNVPAAPQADEYVESAVIESSPAQSEHSVGQSEVAAVTEEAPQHETEAEASAEEEQEEEEYEETTADNEEATQGPVKAEAEEEQKEQSSEEKTESEEEHDEHEDHEEQTTLASVSDETKVETVESPQETQESAAEVTELDSKTEQPVNVVDRIAEVANEQTQSNDVLNADEEKPIAGSDMAPNTLDDESIHEPTLGVTESAAAESLTESVPEYFAEYAPATSGEHVVESSEHQPEPETNAVPPVEAVLSQDSAEREATTPAVPAEQDEYANMEYESEEQDEQKPDADTDAEVEGAQPAVTEQQPMADFEESDSIADILNDLMAESMATEQPQESEAAAQSNAGDLEAEETDVAEEKLGVEQPKPEAVVPAVAAEPNEDTTEEHVATSDKLITFYPELSPENQQLAFEENQAQDVQAAAEPEVTEAPAKLVDEAQQVEEAEAEAESEAQTLSPDELPFDLTSLNDDVQLQTLESANLIVESATQASGELDTNDIEETARVEVIAHTPEPQISEEPTAEPGDIMELTTQTMLGLASRVTLMEPSAPVTTTLQPLMAGEEATPDPSKATQATNMDSSIFTTKATTTEIRKRVELALEAVSLGLPCSNNKQCQLADPNTMCNARGVCDCALSAGASGNPGNGQGQCSAERTGCSAGTFQCRASGVCISWFFVCDGRPDCNDASDEECSFNSRLNQKCPAESFHCERSGRCISRAALCDGRRQCPHGEDEIGCNALKSSNGQCPQHTFRCKSGECLPEYEYCNAIISCKDGSDEPPHLCGARTMPNIFARFLSAGVLQSANDPNAYCPHKCSNGRCRSTAIVCSGRDGCGDGTDEQTCAVCRCPAPATESLPLYLARHRPMPLW